MRDRRQEIEARGATLVVVGTGTPAQAARFAAERAPDVRVLVDPDRAAYQALGLRRGGWSVVNPSSLRNAWRALRSGHGQGTVQGDPWQQGGVFVVDREGAVRYAYASEAAGDHPPLDAVVAAIPRPTG